LFCFGIVGCGGGANAPQPVSGKVSVKGGAPLKKGAIRFTATTAGADKKIVSGMGEIDAQGAFQISSLGVNDGIPVGDYKVTFANTEGGRDYDHPNDPVIPVIADKYGSDSTTDLKYTVKPGRNTCTFELDPAAGK
jgi:hypothetical protein